MPVAKSVGEGLPIKTDGGLLLLYPEPWLRTLNPVITPASLMTASAVAPDPPVVVMIATVGGVCAE